MVDFLTPPSLSVVHPRPCEQKFKGDTLTFCKQIEDWLKELKKKEEESLAQITRDMNTIKGLIPGKISLRSKRALFSGLGQIASSLFGLASADDVAAVAQHLKKYQELGAATANQVKTLGAQIGSFMNASDARISNAITAITDIHSSLEVLTQKVDDNENTSQEMSGLLLVLIKDAVMYLKSYSVIQARSVAWTLGVQDLLRGFLPANIISPDQVQAMLDEVKRALSVEHSGYAIAHNSASYYYQVQDILFTQSDDSMYITVKIPVTSNAAFLDIFSIVALPLPLNGTTRYNSTLIEDLPAYFGITRDAQYYCEFDYKVYASCTGANVKLCPAMLSVRERDVVSCASALYFDMPQRVHDHCEIRYQNGPLFEGALAVGNNYYLVSGSEQESWSLTCDNASPQEIPACLFCVVRLKCNCGLTTDKWKIFAKISQCATDNEDKITVLHTANLPVLHSFYAPAELAKIRGNTGFHKPFSAQIPDLKLGSKNWTNVMQRDRKYSLDFKKIAKSVGSSNAVFETRSDEILHSIGTQSTFTVSGSGGDGFWWWSIINTALSIAGLIGCVYLWCRQRAAVAALLPLAAAQIPLARSYVIPENSTITLSLPTEVRKELATLLDIDRLLLVVSLGLVGFVFLKSLIGPVGFWIRRRRAILLSTSVENRTTWLVLEILSPSKSVQLTLLPLLGHPYDYYIKCAEPTAMFEMSIKARGSCFRRDIELCWPQDCAICHRVTDVEVELPCHVNVLSLATSDLGDILRQNYRCVLSMFFQDLHYPLSDRRECARQTTRKKPARARPVADAREHGLTSLVPSAPRRLYPDLGSDI
jgi:hypothetical protein